MTSGNPGNPLPVLLLLGLLQLLWRQLLADCQSELYRVYVEFDASKPEGFDSDDMYVKIGGQNWQASDWENAAYQIPYHTEPILVRGIDTTALCDTEPMVVLLGTNTIDELCISRLYTVMLGTSLKYGESQQRDAGDPFCFEATATQCVVAWIWFTGTKPMQVNFYDKSDPDSECHDLHPPTRSPTPRPTSSPTADPTPSPSSPTPGPTAPSQSPTSDTLPPTFSPTDFPTREPSFPTNAPTNEPSAAPTINPTNSPSSAPSNFPTITPTGLPSIAPSTAPSVAPSTAPTNNPSQAPTSFPTDVTAPPTDATDFPTRTPTAATYTTEKPLPTSATNVADGADGADGEDGAGQVSNPDITDLKDAKNSNEWDSWNLGWTIGVSSFTVVFLLISWTYICRVWRKWYKDRKSQEAGLKLSPSGRMVPADAKSQTSKSNVLKNAGSDRKGNIPSGAPNGRAPIEVIGDDAIPPIVLVHSKAVESVIKAQNNAARVTPGGPVDSNANVVDEGGKNVDEQHQLDEEIYGAGGEGVTQTGNF